MNPIEYERMYRVEDAHWWYAGMRDIASAFLPALAQPCKILDAGCGTGRNLQMLDHNVTGIDYSRLALQFAKQRQPGKLANADVLHLPFAPATFDLVTSFEVLYHAAVADDVAALREFARVLKPNGHVLLRLPAHRWLTSHHDRAVHTARRYTRRELRQKLQTAGFRVKRLSYVNVLLFPLAVIKRFAEPLLPASADDSDLEIKSQAANRLMHSILATEARLLRHFDCPIYGLSVMALAQKL
ncbi:MAG: class I SAM-dependent methyltransferase [Anaerolineae bacterium]|nr:class I SAM-dependent methyltransferase [Anaerolineae bacterium]